MLSHIRLAFSLLVVIIYFTSCSNGVASMEGEDDDLPELTLNDDDVSEVFKYNGLAKFPLTSQFAIYAICKKGLKCLSSEVGFEECVDFFTNDYICYEKMKYYECMIHECGKRTCYSYSSCEHDCAREFCTPPI